MWHYRPDEPDVISFNGIPSGTVLTPTLGINNITGVQYWNPGGSTWTQRGGVEAIVAARTLTAADNGKTFTLALATGFTVTLPANATVGFKCTFLVAIAPTTAYIIAAATADTMAGSCFDISGGATDTETAFSGDQLNFVANTSVIGDRAEIFIDGTYGVFAHSWSGAAGGTTITG